MIFSARSDSLEIHVSTHGAELQSIKSSGIEWLWQGDPDIWSGRSPILFPIVGRLLDDSYYYQSQPYHLKKHGFARNSDFTLTERSEKTLEFSLSSTSELKKSFPFDFDLRVGFSVENSKLTVTHTVFNLGDETMYFSIGAHPGFCCEMGDIIRFSQPETLYSERIHLDSALRLPGEELVIDNGTDLIITPDIFKNDALIFENVKSKYVTLIKKDGFVRFELDDPPYLGFWAKPGAPYVCIEPWYGVNDDFRKRNDISEKDAIISLQSESSFSFYWSAEFI